jgi:hypothetical protein
VTPLFPPLRQRRWGGGEEELTPSYPKAHRLRAVPEARLQHGTIAEVVGPTTTTTTTFVEVLIHNNRHMLWRICFDHLHGLRRVCIASAGSGTGLHPHRSFPLSFFCTTSLACQVVSLWWASASDSANIACCGRRRSRLHWRR